MFFVENQKGAIAIDFVEKDRAFLVLKVTSLNSGYALPGFE